MDLSSGTHPFGVPTSNPKPLVVAWCGGWVVFAWRGGWVVAWLDFACAIVVVAICCAKTVPPEGGLNVVVT